MRELTYHEKRFLKALRAEKVDFVVVGTWAAVAHGLDEIVPADLDVLIGTDITNAQAFARAWDRVDPQPGARSVTRDIAPSQMLTVILGAGKADVLTSIEDVDFRQALTDCVPVRIDGVELPILARRDLEATLEASDRQRDRDRLKLLRDKLR